MDIQDLQRRAELLRTELKTWERNNSSNGQKPTRQVIKQNPDIARKYTEFQRLKDSLSGKPQKPAAASSSSTSLPISNPAPSPEPSKPEKRKHPSKCVEAQTQSTPKKRLSYSTTPSKSPSSLKPYDIDPYDSPSLIRRLFTPSNIKFIGPTPQKDGQPIGLFDLLSPESETPIKGFVNIDVAMGLTPSKSFAGDMGSVWDGRGDARKHGEAQTLGHYLTPSNRQSKTQAIPHATPSTAIPKLDFFATPSFLRRGNPAPYNDFITDENGDPQVHSPQMIRKLPRKSMMRGLSSIAADLRRVQEEAADEELDILREMENEATNVQPILTTLQAAKERIDEVIQVGDSQYQPPSGLLGGFDDIAMYDSDVPETQMDRGRPLRVYKKKGQKRTTRKTNLKPVRGTHAASSKTKNTKHGTNDSDFSDSSDDHLPSLPVEEIPDLNTSTLHTPSETLSLQQETFRPSDARNFDSDSEASEYTASEGGTRRRRPKQKLKAAKGQRMRKVGSLATSNFQRLKLRNSGAKGGVGKRGFGKGRR